MRISLFESKKQLVYNSTHLLNKNKFKKSKNQSKRVLNKEKEI